MKLGVISFKECWQDESGHWYSSGGFPRQMEAICSLFEHSQLLVTRGKPKRGGIPLPKTIYVRAIRLPVGHDFRRKVDLILTFPYYLYQILRMIWSADVIHTPLPGDIPLIGMMVSLACGKPLIARYAGSWAKNNQNTPINDFTRTIMRRFAGGKRVMLVTGSGSVPPGKGMNWIFSSAITREELQQAQPDLNRGLSNPIQLATIGRLSPEKGFAVVLQAAAKVRDVGLHPALKWHLIGDGPERKRLEQMVRELKLGHFVSFEGQLDRKQLAAKLENIDLCVQASLTEGFSKAWLDAFMYGVPLIASSVGASCEVVGNQAERGWLVNPGDVSGLVKCLHEVLSADQDWPGLRQRCRAYVENKTLEDWTNKIGNICADQWQLSFHEGRLKYA